jgi:hypothetical protein
MLPQDALARPRRHRRKLLISAVSEMIAGEVTAAPATAPTTATMSTTMAEAIPGREMVAMTTAEAAATGGETTTTPAANLVINDTSAADLLLANAIATDQLMNDSQLLPDSATVAGLSKKERAHLSTALAAFKKQGFNIFELTAAEEPVALQRIKVGPTTTRLKSVAGIGIHEITQKVLSQLCVSAKIKGYSRKPFGTVCEAIVQAKLSKCSLAEMPGNAGQQVREESCPQLAGSIAKKDANRLRLINCIFCGNEIRELYAQFYQQPSRNILTARQTHNQLLFEKLMEEFNNTTNKDLETSLHPSLVEKVPLLHHEPFQKLVDVSTLLKAIHQEYRHTIGKMGRSGSHGEFSDYTSSVPLLYYAECLVQYPHILSVMSRNFHLVQYGSPVSRVEQMGTSATTTRQSAAPRTLLPGFLQVMP